MSILNNTDRKTLLIIFFIIIIVNTLHKHFSIINLCSESWQHQSLDMCAIRNTLTHGCQIFVLFIWLQSTHRLRERFSMRSSQMRVLRPLPSMKGWATFISTYLSIISSKVVSGIRSIICKVSGKCIQLAKVKPPLDIFLVRICPAKSYNPPKR